MNKKTIKTILQNGLTIAVILLLVSVYLFLWKIQITNPEIYHTSDFIAFYTAGKIANEEGASQVYDLQKQLDIQSTLREKEIAPNELLSYNHLPFLIPLLKAITNENYTASFTRWGLILLAINIGSTIILLKVFPGFSREEQIVAAAGIVLFFPSIISILQGQDTVILLLGASIWMVGLLQKKDKLAGFGLALVTVRPHIALVLAIPFIFKRRMVWWWFLLGALTLALFSIALIDVEGTRDFIQLLIISSRGEGFQLKPEAMFNLVGILARMIPTISHKTLEIIGWSGFGIAMIGLSVLWKKSKEINEAHIGMAVLLSLFTAPHLHYHDLALLLLPLLAVLRIAISEKKITVGVVSIIPLNISFILFINHYLPSIYPIPYLFMFILAVLPWVLYSSKTKHIIKGHNKNVVKSS
ncbi:MAG: glycosyltransferase family 87 protein [Methanosarcinaceae archaeon]